MILKTGQQWYYPDRMKYIFENYNGWKDKNSYRTEKIDRNEFARRVKASKIKYTGLLLK